MWCNQIFSIINEGIIQNIIVCDNYEIANQIAKINYGDDAYAVDTTHYLVYLGCKHIDGIFYDENDNTIKKNPTEQEKIQELELQYNELKIEQIETALESDYRLCLLELGLV